jgi:hypothetical protein
MIKSSRMTSTYVVGESGLFVIPELVGLNSRKTTKAGHRLSQLITSLRTELRFFESVAYPGIFSEVLTNSVEDRGQTERGSGDGTPQVRGSAQFANE